MANDGQVIHLKKEILVRLIKAFYSENFPENTRLIAYDMRPKGAEVPYRCCIYKERAIIKDRVIAGLGFQIEEDDEKTSLTTYAQNALKREKIDDKNLTVLQAACKGCVPSQIYITDLCQGCVDRPCQNACKFGAIQIQNGKSHIDGTKCKKCTMCLKACPYNAIVKLVVPCENACPVGAITKDESGFASIDYTKCINCGKCIASCPFGAVHEKSQIIDILKEIQNKDNKVVALLAPSIAGEFPGTIFQIKTAMLKVGFDDVFEVAHGADITSKNEAKEFKDRILQDGQKFMTTSCCAGYNQLIKKHLAEIKPYVSSTQTPMYYEAEYVKNKYPQCKIVFVSPCVAKRAEGFENKNIDYVLSFEELGALFVANHIEILKCEETPFEKDSSAQGRAFGVAGGVAQAIKKSLSEEESVKPCYVCGFNKENIKQLKKYAKDGQCEEGCNLVEVMCCEGGCIGGNATTNKNLRSAKKLIDYFVQNSKAIDKID